MNKLIVDDHNMLQEFRPRPDAVHSIIARFFAKIISYIFHPLFIPVYISWFIVRIQPYLFSGFSEWDKKVIMLRFLVMYALFPLVTVLLLKGLGFIKSIYLRTQKDRIIPYIACGVFYFWMWYVLHNQPEWPHPVVVLALAVFIASSAGQIANIYMKVSMHAISVGVMCTFVGMLAFTQETNFGTYISVAVFITGLVCTARFIISDHTPKEIYGGLIIGILSQVIAFYIG